MTTAEDKFKKGTYFLTYLMNVQVGYNINPSQTIGFFHIGFLTNIIGVKLTCGHKPFSYGQQTDLSFICFSFNGTRKKLFGHFLMWNMNM